MINRRKQDFMESCGIVDTFEFTSHPQGSFFRLRCKMDGMMIAELINSVPESVWGVVRMMPYFFMAFFVGVGLVSFSREVL